MISFEIVIRREAQVDVDEIFVWYEEQKQSLGLEFIEALENTLDRIVRNPYHALLIEKDARSATLKRFPYEIIYRVDDAKMQVRIIAVIHQHRNPEWFYKRLRQ